MIMQAQWLNHLGSKTLYYDPLQMLQTVSRPDYFNFSLAMRWLTDISDGRFFDSSEPKLNAWMRSFRHCRVNNLSTVMQCINRCLIHSAKEPNDLDMSKDFLIYRYSYELTFQNVMHDVGYQSINNTEVTTSIKDRFIGNSIGCCNVGTV